MSCFVLLKKELARFGLTYHFSGLPILKRNILTWSRNEDAYKPSEEKLPLIKFDFLECEQKFSYSKIILRKNQIILFDNDIIIKQLFKASSRIGLIAEKKQRLKLKSRGSNLAPKLYEIDVELGLVKEENFIGKSFTDYLTNENKIINSSIEVYEQLIKKGDLSEVNIFKHFSLYKNKLKRLEKKISNQMLSKFLDNVICDIELILSSQDKNTLITFTDLVHGDFNPNNNILINNSGIIKIIDWEHSTAGPVLFDLFYMLIHLKLEPKMFVKRFSEISQKKLHSHEEMRNQIMMCFLLLIIIKLNLFLGKDRRNEKSLTKRLTMLEHNYFILKNFNIKGFK